MAVQHHKCRHTTEAHLWSHCQSVCSSLLTDEIPLSSGLLSLLMILFLKYIFGGKKKLVIYFTNLIILENIATVFGRGT